MTKNTRNPFRTTTVQGRQSRKRPGTGNRPELRASMPDFCRGVELLPLPDKTMKLMLHVIARSCREDGTTTFLGRAHLALALGVTEDHVTRLKKRARALGLLDYQSRGSRDGRLHDRFVLLVPPVTHEEMEAIVKRLKGGESQPDLFRSHCATRHLTASNPTSAGLQPDVSTPRNPTSGGRGNHQKKNHQSDHQKDHRAPAGEGEDNVPSRSYMDNGRMNPKTTIPSTRTPTGRYPTSEGRVAQPDIAEVISLMLSDPQGARSVKAGREQNFPDDEIVGVTVQGLRDHVVMVNDPTIAKKILALAG